MSLSSMPALVPAVFASATCRLWLDAGGSAAHSLSRMRRIGILPACALAPRCPSQVACKEMPLEGEYEPSPWAWVREQVAEYEASNGQRANTLLDTELPVVIVTMR